MVQFNFFCPDTKSSRSRLMIQYQCSSQIQNLHISLLETHSDVFLCKATLSRELSTFRYSLNLLCFFPLPLWPVSVSVSMYVFVCVVYTCSQPLKSKQTNPCSSATHCQIAQFARSTTSLWSLSACFSQHQGVHSPVNSSAPPACHTPLSVKTVNKVCTNIYLAEWIGAP